MKTTLEISDSLFRKAKATAAQRGQTLKRFVTEALQEKLGNAASQTKPSWMTHFGAFGKTAKVRAETRRIQRLIDAEFEQLEPEDGP